ncbi:hypothetical protein EVAR_80155_1 [Eumeta japonica]|uniref:Uncharacterized protein n=1 Tax=Eumeta variegata TaxID=151549 RepID=A0A4C1YA83_EUMVA|nr:hypothetical protein EVAR_80155_1 [Eumeta japonica]
MRPSSTECFSIEPDMITRISMKYHKTKWSTSLRSRHIVDLALSESDQSQDLQVLRESLRQRSQIVRRRSHLRHPPHHITNQTVPDFDQPKNQAQVPWEVSTDVEECTSGTKKLLMELGITTWGSQRNLYVIEIEDTEHDIMSCRFMEAEMDVDHEKLLVVTLISNGNETSPHSLRLEKSFVHPVGAAKDYDSPYDAFIDIFDVDIMKEIVIETNRYAHQVRKKITTKKMSTIVMKELRLGGQGQKLQYRVEDAAHARAVRSRSLISRSELRLDRTKTICSFGDVAAAFAYQNT